MKKYFLIPIVFALILTGCKKETPFKTVPIVKETGSQATKKECYSYEKNGDTISLQIETTGKEVIGAMVYSLKEKDRNAGLLKGKLENNILIADYTFHSEGTESTRQVAFKLENGQFIEGYGEVTLDGTHFKDISKIKYSSTMPLGKTECP
ncbi:MAG: hypothetical protein QM710_03675 [Flavobacterium sp.]